MADFITKSKKVKGEMVETTYRVDASFVPTAINDICNEFIENWCVANNKVEWLVQKVNTTSYQVKRKDGTIDTVECDNYPFVNLRRDFVETFFPSIIKGEAKKETFKDKINRLYGKK